MGEYVALSKVEGVLKGSKYTILPMCYAQSTMSYCIALICPNEAEMKKVGRYRQEGKNYEVQDGDVIFFKFNVTAPAKKK